MAPTTAFRCLFTRMLPEPMVNGTMLRASALWLDLKPKRIARFVYDSAAKRNLQGNRFVPAEHCWPQSLAMCDNTKCPAILIEAMFYDNKSDLALLTSDEGRELITEAIVEGLTKFLQSL